MLKPIWTAIASLLPLAACGNATSDTSSGTTTTGSGATCSSYASAKSGVSFKNDVIPIFQLSCNFSSCHSSDSPSPKGDLGLGLKTTMTADDVKAVYDKLVKGKSTQSSLALIEPGLPEESWLVAKVTYASSSECAPVAESCGKTCGGRMPLNNAPIPAAALDTIAGWVKDGAKDN